MNEHVPTALIAEDEPLLARSLVRMLGKQWPSLKILAVVHDGNSAIETALALLPEVLFLDIKMPGCSGLDVVERIVEGWPQGRALPLIVFVTAFDRFAVDAFERAALDYVLKPVESERLALTCSRLQARLAEQQRSDASALAPFHALRQAAPSSAPLMMIQAAIGHALHVVPVSDVHYFEADNKYVRVVTESRSLLIRTPLRDLLPRLDMQQFLQVHRGTVVRMTLIDKVIRDDTGKTHLYLKGRSERLPVSRSYAHLFKPM